MLSPPPPALVTPHVPLQAEGDRAFELESLKGRWVWLYFGYTNCPDACPQTLGLLAGEQRKLGRPERVQPVFVSVDPARDTPARLAAYARYFGQGFMGVTGDEPALRRLTAGLGVRYELGAPARPGGPYEVGHPDVVFLLDPEGRVAGRYGPEALAGLAAETERLDGLPAADRWAAERLATGQTAAGLAAAGPGLETASAWCGNAGGLGGRMRAMGSGTSVLPAAAPMRLWEWQAGPWSFMAGGLAKLGYDVQTGLYRGKTDRAAENDLMLMAAAPVGKGILDLHLMGSAEPWTTPPGGTPQLFQFGETYQGNPVVDAQHQHDMLMELAGRYTVPLDARTSLFVYGGPAGEPALGPPSYMHRPSATENHWAPLGHHNQDATHTSYGVATAGVRRDAAQLEVSAFNGREPDEDRTNVELAPLDSFAGRISWFPGSDWSLQASVGRLHDTAHNMIARYGVMAGMPGMGGEELRLTASAMNVLMTPLGPLTSMAVWGENLDLSGEGASQSYGLEGELDVLGGDHLYGRFELVDRPGFAILTPRVGALTLGCFHELPLSSAFSFGLGADATATSIDTSLQAIYGTNPCGFQVYMRLAPPLRVSM